MPDPVDESQTVHLHTGTPVETEVTYFFLTTAGGEIIEIKASSRDERRKKMKELHIDARRPYAFGHFSYSPSNRGWQIAGTNGPLQEELRRRLRER